MIARSGDWRQWHHGRFGIVGTSPGHQSEAWRIACCGVIWGGMLGMENGYGMLGFAEASPKWPYYLYFRNMVAGRQVFCSDHHIPSNLMCITSWQNTYTKRRRIIARFACHTVWHSEPTGGGKTKHQFGMEGKGKDGKERPGRSLTT